MTTDGSFRYSVFEAATGKRAVVVDNTELSKAIAAKVELPNPGKPVVATPEHSDAEPTDGTGEIPAESVAVVMER